MARICINSACESSDDRSGLYAFIAKLKALGHTVSSIQYDSDHIVSDGDNYGSNFDYMIVIPDTRVFAPNPGSVRINGTQTVDVNCFMKKCNDPSRVLVYCNDLFSKVLDNKEIYVLPMVTKNGYHINTDYTRMNRFASLNSIVAPIKARVTNLDDLYSDLEYEDDDDYSFFEHEDEDDAVEFKDIDVQPFTITRTTPLVYTSVVAGLTSEPEEEPILAVLFLS